MSRWTSAASSSARQSGRQAITQWLIVAICLCLVLAAPACKQETPAKTQTKTAIPYPDQLSADSPPTQVAEVLIAALDAGDTRTLAGLVAAQAATARIDEIYRKHGKKPRGKSLNPMAAVVWGWKSTYGFFQKGSVRVVEQTVEGSEATVRAKGKNKATGQPQALTILLTRENGLWKVKPGLQS